MKIILLQNISKLGSKHDVKDVKDGFAQNFLFPNKLAINATAGAIREIEKNKETERIAIEKQEKLLTENLSKIKGITLTLKEHANEKGSLFASVDKEQISQALKEQQEIEILSEYLVLDKPLKEIGEYDVTVAIKDKKAAFKLVIEEE